MGRLFPNGLVALFAMLLLCNKQILAEEVFESVPIEEEPIPEDDWFSSESEIEFDLQDDGLQHVFDELKARLCELDEKIGEMKDTFQSTLLDLGHAVNKDKCDVFYNGYCFHAIVVSSPGPKYAEVERLCGNLGWKVGIIYDAEHQHLVETYMRSKIKTNEDQILLWTGITLQTENQTAASPLGDNIDVSVMKWLETEDANSTQVAILARLDPQDEDQGLVKYNENTSTDGVLCEL